MDAAWVSAIASVISAVGALAAVGVVVWSERRSRHPQVRVEVGPQIGLYDGGPGRPMFGITVQNRGLLPVTIVSVAYEVRGDLHAPMLDPRTMSGQQALPARIEPGEAVMVVDEFARVAMLNGPPNGPIRAVAVTSAVGDKYRVRVRGGWIDGWARRVAGG